MNNWENLEQSYVEVKQAQNAVEQAKKVYSEKLIKLQKYQEKSKILLGIKSEKSYNIYSIIVDITNGLYFLYMLGVLAIYICSYFYSDIPFFVNITFGTLMAGVVILPGYSNFATTLLMMVLLPNISYSNLYNNEISIFFLIVFLFIPNFCLFVYLFAGTKVRKELERKLGKDPFEGL